MGRGAGAQYRGEVGVLSTVGDIMSNMKDILSTVGDTQYRGGGILPYHDAHGRKSFFILVPTRY